MKGERQALAPFAEPVRRAVLPISEDQFDFVLEEQGVDDAAPDVDRWGQQWTQPYLTRTLHRGPRVTAASPAYLKKHGTPKVPEDLARHNCITSNYGPVWHFNQRGRVVPVTVKGNLVVTGGEAMRERR